MGPIEVPADVYYGAQTAPSLIHFAIGDDNMPPELIRALGTPQEGGGAVNRDLGKLPPDKADSSSGPPTRSSPASSTTSFR